MTSEISKSICLKYANRNSITISRIEHENNVSYALAKEVYSELLSCGEFREAYYVECPNCASEVRDGDAKYANNVIDTESECAHCGYQFTIKSQDIFKILYLKIQKKKAS